MGPDDEDIFVARVHASRIRDRDEWEQDTGVHHIPQPQVIFLKQPNSDKSGLIPKTANAIAKVMSAGKSWPAVIIFALVVFAFCFYIYITQGAR